MNLFFWKDRTKEHETSFRLDTISPAALSRQLRNDRGGFLSHRRGILSCALGAAGSMGVVALYQMGIISHLPEPPLPRLDADKVDASPAAYAWFSMPDAPIGLASYAATAVLASIGGTNRAERLPWLPVLLALKTGADATQAAKLTRDQWTQHGAFCAWCLLAAGFSLGAAALALPEAQAALRSINTR
jgi:uncharacterized membrane protein